MPRKRAPSRIERLINRINNPQDVSISWTIAAILLVVEALLCLAIIAKVPYTEIDWRAYMDEVAGYDKGERDYMKLKGDTGPLVYPAGFVYLFSWLRSITHEAILPAQYIFAGLYLATQFVVMALYINSRTMPPWSLVLLCLSRRLHSIFVLRLFNDCWAMCIAYGATWALQKRKIPLSIFLFSLAVSVKMNVLLFAPGVLAVVIKEARVGEAVRGVIAGIILQGLLALPFLTTYPTSYLSRAFEFSRVFTFKWSVNWQFLPEEIFTSQRFALALLFLHMRFLWSFAQYHWLKEEGGILPALTSFFQRGGAAGREEEVANEKTKKKTSTDAVDNDAVLKIVFTSNFVGILCARSLHYQFYSWYFHTLPFLLLRTRLPAYFSIILLCSIEVIMNIFPPREWTSALLMILHASVLWSVWAFPRSAPKHGEPQPPPKRPRPITPCQHEVAVPAGYKVPKMDPMIYGTIEDPLWDGEMAKQYEFKLDPFQATSVACIERNESVLVAAHTSAGKTAVAEYAIAKALQNNQRVVYTSPLKALSNQKYRELTEEFKDVGLMTGDVTLNPNAPCIVMTTEILRSMIYKGSELLREVAWVVFDEVHYMKDRERGVVWEEVIIFMPKDARMVFLSATLPNSFQFAEWIAAVHGAPCHVVSTDYRPTPLVHYAFPLGGNGLYLLVDDKGNFKSDNFNKMASLLKGSEEQALTGPGPGNSAPAITTTPAGARGKFEKGRRSGGGGRDGGGDKDKTPSKSDKKVQGPPVEEELGKLLHLLKDKDMQPVIIFSFNRRECEAYANLVGGAAGAKKKQQAGRDSNKRQPKVEPLDFNSPKEKEAVADIFNNAMACLSEEDKNLPCIRTMLPMLQRGVAVHHSGLLPILKELVEVLFQETLVKCLFSTETFAMGLNMPAKTVIFTTLTKFDGEETRFIESGEYIQMSGRAGRRGKDDRGYAIMLADHKLDEPTCRSMVKGTAAPLMSSFKLTYYTLLNLLKRLEGQGRDMEYVISKSFSQFQHEKELPEKMEKAAALRREAESIAISAGTNEMEAFIRAQQDFEASHRVIMNAVLQPDRCIHFLRAGRIVRAKNDVLDLGYGVVVSVMRPGKPGTERGKNGSGSASGAGAGGNIGDKNLSANSSNSAAENYVVDLLLCAKFTAKDQIAPCSLEDPEGEMMVVPVPLPLLCMLSTLRIAIPSNLVDAKARDTVRSTLKELVTRYPGGNLPELDPIADIGITDDDEVKKAVQVEKEANAILQKMTKSSKSKSPTKNTKNKSSAADTSEKESIKNEDAVETGQGVLGKTGVVDYEAELRRKAQLLMEADSIEREMQLSQLTHFKEESKSRFQVLKKLGHVDAKTGMVTLKGRAASAIDTADELLTSELMFDGTFGSLDKHQLAALVSCLVPVENTNSEIQLQVPLANALGRLQQTARHIAETSTECKLPVDADEYVGQFKATLMNVVYEWSKGASFGAICEITDVFEGSIIRAIRRLDELMNNLQAAAVVVGDKHLADSFEASRETLRRGLPFAASLYI